jgi:hypothetical protein
MAACHCYAWWSWWSDSERLSWGLRLHSLLLWGIPLQFHRCTVADHVCVHSTWTAQSYLNLWHQKYTKNQSTWWMGSAQLTVCHLYRLQQQSSSKRSRDNRISSFFIAYQVMFYTRSESEVGFYWHWVSDHFWFCTLWSVLALCAQLLGFFFFHFHLHIYIRTTNSSLPTKLYHFLMFETGTNSGPWQY